MKDYRKQPGKLDPNLSNARESAVARLMSKQAQKMRFDFDADGGAVGDIDFGAKLPEGSVVTNAWIDVETAATSGGTPTLTLKCGGTSVSKDFWTEAQAVAADDVSAAAPAKCSGELSLEIGTAALTAGKFSCWVEFVG